jgi:hypothetical protein
MNFESSSHEELGETDPKKVDIMRKSTSKAVPDNKSSLEKQSTEPIYENRKHTSHFSEFFSPKRQFSKVENLKNNFHEESKGDEKKVKASLHECEDSVFSKDKATVKDKDSSDKEDISEEEKIIKPSKSVEQSLTQVHKCFDFLLKDGDQFRMHESSYNLNTNNLCFGSKVLLAIKRDIITDIREDCDLPVTTEYLEEFRHYKVIIVNAVILPSLQRIMELWYKEKHLSESTFGNE